MRRQQRNSTYQLVSISNSDTTKSSCIMSNHQDSENDNFDDEPPSTAPYQRVEVDQTTIPENTSLARSCVRNFTLMSFLFSANHGCVVGKSLQKDATMIMAILLLADCSSFYLVFYACNVLQRACHWQRLSLDQLGPGNPVSYI